MANINRDLDRYLRKRGESRQAYSGPSWFDKMFTAAEKEEAAELAPEQAAKLEEVEGEMMEAEHELDSVHELEEELEEKQEERIGLYHQLVGFFRHKNEEPKVEEYDVEEEDASTEDFRSVTMITMRWLERLPHRVKQEFKDSDDYQEFTEILERHGVARRK